MQSIIKLIINEDLDKARELAREQYPFRPSRNTKRSYTKKQMLAVFLRDGFIGRYSGQKLYNPGLLRLLNHLLPGEFPFHAHGRMDLCHEIYWSLMPSIDHLTPISRGGKDSFENWITTSMRRNMAKSLWSLDELGWKLHKPGSIKDWDGLSKLFIQAVEKFQIEDKYISEWYRTTKKLTY